MSRSQDIITRDYGPDGSRRQGICTLCGAIVSLADQVHDDWHRRLNATFGQTARYVDQLRQALDRAGVKVEVEP